MAELSELSTVTDLHRYGVSIVGWDSAVADGMCFITSSISGWGKTLVAVGRGVTKQVSVCVTVNTHTHL